MSAATDDYSASIPCRYEWLDVGAALTVTVVNGTRKSYLAHVYLDTAGRKCLRWNDSDEIKDGDQ